MADELRVDVDIPLPLELRDEAVLHAIQENPLNVPGVHCEKPKVLALSRSQIWAPGRILRIRFIDGEPLVQQRIMETAIEWTEYANLTFDFGSYDEAEIRVSLLTGSSWSYVGTDALAISQEKPTMNLGWLSPDSPQETYSQVVLHEFGHAIGCIHEHQAPNTGIKWNKYAVYRYYRIEFGWDRETVDQNVIYAYDRNSTNSSQFDPLSIMIYPIPKEHTLNGYEVEWNSELSETDKEFIAQVYPKGR